MISCSINVCEWYVMVVEHSIFRKGDTHVEICLGCALFMNLFNKEVHMTVTMWKRIDWTKSYKLTTLNDWATMWKKN